MGHGDPHDMGNKVTAVATTETTVEVTNHPHTISHPRFAIYIHQSCTPFQKKKKMENIPH